MPNVGEGATHGGTDRCNNLKSPLPHPSLFPTRFQKRLSLPETKDVLLVHGFGQRTRLRTRTYEVGRVNWLGKGAALKSGQARARGHPARTSTCDTFTTCCGEEALQIVYTRIAHHPTIAGSRKRVYRGVTILSAPYVAVAVFTHAFAEASWKATLAGIK